MLWVLQEAGGNQTLAAQILGIDRVSLWRKLKRYSWKKTEPHTQSPRRRVRKIPAGPWAGDHPTRPRLHLILRPACGQPPPPLTGCCRCCALIQSLQLTQTAGMMIFLTGRLAVIGGNQATYPTYASDFSLVVESAICFRSPGFPTTGTGWPPCLVQTWVHASAVIASSRQ